MSGDPTTIAHPDLVRAIVREGCALRLLRDVVDTHGRMWPKGAALTCGGVLGDTVVTEIDATLLFADVAVDLTRPSGQWAAARWLDLSGKRGPWLAAYRGEADPAELRRVVYAIAGVSDAP